MIGILSSFFYRLASCYEDKVLGHSTYKGTFGSLKGKTFPQFIDHILKDSTTRQSEHWRPQFMNCHYCEIRYDMIGRVETFYKDLNYIASISNFSTASRSHLMVNAKNSPNTSTTEEKTIKYFSTLNSTQLYKLYNLYRMDFEIFGYHVYPFVLDSNHNNI